MAEPVIYQLDGITGDCFESEAIPDTSTEQLLRQALCVAKIRFDGCPGTYTKEDYQYLINSLSSALITLYQRNPSDTQDPIVQLIGIATTTTNPEQERISLGNSLPGIYLLQTSGTYTYFNGLVISESDLVNSVLFAIPQIEDGVFTTYTLSKYNLTTSQNLIDEDIVVSLADGKTLGRYVNGETIPAAGKSIQDVLKLIAQEPIPPIVSFGFDPSQVPTTWPYAHPNPINKLKFTYNIDTAIPETVYESFKLEYKRSSNNTWIDISSSVVTNFQPKSGTGTITHSIVDNESNDTINYRLTINDSNDQETISLFNVQFSPYVAETITLSAASTALEMGTTKVSLTIVFNNPNSSRPLTSFDLWRSINGAQFTSIKSFPNISSGHRYDDSNNINSPSNIVKYKIVGKNDLNQEVTSNTVTVRYYAKSYLGYSDTPLTAASILNLPNGELAINGHQRTITNVTAESYKYTYYVYPTTTPLTNVIQNDSAPVLGAFTRLSNIQIIQNGTTITYSIYKSNAPGAFTGDKLTFE